MRHYYIITMLFLYALQTLRQIKRKESRENPIIQGVLPSTSKVRWICTIAYTSQGPSPSSHQSTKMGKDKDPPLFAQRNISLWCCSC